MTHVQIMSISLCSAGNMLMTQPIQHVHSVSLQTVFNPHSSLIRCMHYRPTISNFNNARNHACNVMLIMIMTILFTRLDHTVLMLLAVSQRYVSSNLTSSEHIHPQTILRQYYYPGSSQALIGFGSGVPFVFLYCVIALVQRGVWLVTSCC